MLGKTLSELSQEFNCTKLTIVRNLKKKLGEEKYKEIIKKNKISEGNQVDIKQIISYEQNNASAPDYLTDNSEDGNIQLSPFIEIEPLNYEIENSFQKDLASVPIAEVEFPNIVYMIVDKKVELEIKSLKDYPQWSFLSQDELERKTFEIYFDLKIAKGYCSKEQKVVKVTNTDVFKKVKPILLSRGISRIVTPDKLIAL